MPESLSSLVDEGIIDEVVRPLMSGKEAQVYLVEVRGQQYVAKIYKEAQNRTFKHRTSYTEGRKVRNSRDQRAMNRRSRHGREQDEQAWRATEVDMIYRLQAAGVRVPQPYQYIDGVLIMELVLGSDGLPAPRLGDVSFDSEQAVEIYQRLLRETVRMLCAGVIHGDLSDFNVLLGHDGPVIIDFPQAIDPSKNQNARRLLLRDVENLHRFVTRFAGPGRRKPYAEEMWKLYESNRLLPDTPLAGTFRGNQKKADTGALLELLDEVGPTRPRSAGEPGAIRPRRVEVIVNTASTGRGSGGRGTGSRSAGGSAPASRGGRRGERASRGQPGVSDASRGGQAARGQSQGRGQVSGEAARNSSGRRGGPGRGEAKARSLPDRRDSEGSSTPLRMAPQGIGNSSRVHSSDSAPPKLRMLAADGSVVEPGSGKKRRRRRRRPAAAGAEAAQADRGGNARGGGSSDPAPRRSGGPETSGPAARASAPRDPSSSGAVSEGGEPSRRRRRRRPRAAKAETS